jgi:2-iminobutanoate/2-iminopropanoate deaminase
MMTRQIVRTPNAPLPGGPYSQGIRAGDFVYVAAQGPADPKTGNIVSKDIESQTRQTLDNIKAIVEASGLSMRHVIRMTVFLRKPEDFQKMNRIYAEFFPESPPARTTVTSLLVDSDALIEVDAIAYRGT